jgi:hypothetical protein
MMEWQHILTAPRDQVIQGKIYHGNRYSEGPVKFSSYHNGWISTDPDSCVAYIIDGAHSSKNEAYWKPELINERVK